jgi:mutator protein MutT
MEEKNIQYDFRRSIPSGAIIFNDKNEILMCQRISNSGPWHGKWQFPGGTIEFGEDPKATAIRETFEEVGVNIKLQSDFPIVMNYSNKERNEDFICIAYLAKYLGGEIDPSQDHAISDAKWFKYQDIEFDNCLPFTREMLEIAMKLIN